MEIDSKAKKNAQVKQAKKYVDLEEYDKAMDILYNILRYDDLDIDNYCLFIIVNLKALPKDINDNASRVGNRSYWNKIDNITNSLERLKKIDKENISENLLKDYKKELNEVQKVIDKLDERTKELHKVVEKFNKGLNKCREIDSNYGSRSFKSTYYFTLRNSMGLDKNVYYEYSGKYDEYLTKYPEEIINEEKYKMEFTRITPDGYVYFTLTRKSDDASIEYYSHVEDLNQSYEQILEKVNAAYEVGKKLINDKIDSVINDTTKKLNSTRIYKSITYIILLLLAFTGYKNHHPIITTLLIIYYIYA